jgi:Type I phosphodiesterase / nucleotide pyrophosphatase
VLPARVCVLAAVLFSGCAPAPRDPVAPKNEPRPPFVVTIVVDQLAAWIADERWRELPSTGGFARLVREGTRARDMRYAHAVTDTAPGHAALYTGATPRLNGIVANETPVDLEKRESFLIDSKATLLLQPPANPPRAGSSIRALDPDSTTLADQLRAAHPDAYIVALSLKDRGAIFAGGRDPSVVLWYDAREGAWATSSAFPRADRRLLERRALPEPLPTWTPFDARWVARHAATEDAQPGEGDLGGLGTTFPHALGQAQNARTAFRATPFADEALAALALAALDDPRAKAKATLVAISFSANDYVGHTFGPDSWEAWDELFRLDATLARFFAELDRRYGASGWSAVLSADHGVVRMPEAFRGCAAGASQDRWARPCDAGHRIYGSVLGGDLARAADAALGTGRWIKGVADPYVYLTDEAANLEPARKEKLLAALEARIKATPGVRAVYRTSVVAARACPPDADESEDALVCRSVRAGAGGALYVMPAPASFFDPDLVVGKGTSHGTPYLYDRSVPLVARAPGKVAAGATIDGPIGFGAFVRTAASLLGIEPPRPAAAARDLTRP